MGYGNTANPGLLWWEEIAGPARLVSEIESALADCSSVVCNVRTSLSFQWNFRDSIDHWMSVRNVMVVHIDCAGAYDGGDITAFLLQRLQPRYLTDYLRRRSPRYLRDKGLLRGKLLWMRGIAPEHQAGWIQFLSDFHDQDADNGLMLLELQRTAPVKVPANLRYFDCDDYIRRDDLRLYASVLSEGCLTEPTGVKQYAVELAAALCVTDAELANDLLSQPAFVTEDPAILLRRVMEVSYSGDARGMEAWHPFALLRQDDQAELRYRVWSAQVRIGYPRIELERLNLIRRWYHQIQEVLYSPCLNDGNGSFVNYESEPIRDPYDLEVSMLLRLCCLRRPEDPSQYLFPHSDQNTRDLLRLLRDCRNNLAHLDICEPDLFYLLVAGE